MADVTFGPARGPVGDRVEAITLDACWRGRTAMVSELLARGAALRFGNGSALGATLHSARNCHEPEGGPAMRILDEIPAAPYAAIARTLLAADAAVPERIDGVPAATLLAELGVEPPD